MLKKTLILLLTALLLQTAACSALKQADLWKDPKVSLANAKVTALNFEGASLDVVLDVLNPNKFDISYGALEYAVDIEQARLFAGKLDQSGKLGAGKTQQITVPLSFKFADIMSILDQAGGADSLNYGLSGGLYFNIPVAGQVKIPLKTEGTLPMLKKPKVTLAGLDVSKMSVSGAELLLKLGVENPNSFDLGLSGFNYSLGLNGNKVASGKSQQKTSWAAGQSKELAIPIQLSFLDGGMALYNMLRSNELDYSLSFDSVLDSSSLPIIKKLPFSTKQDGRVKLN